MPGEEGVGEAQGFRGTLDAPGAGERGGRDGTEKDGPKVVNAEGDVGRSVGGAARGLPALDG